MAESRTEIEFELPFVWENPEADRLSWWTDRWHFPDPVTPLAFDYARILFGDMNRARVAKGEPGGIRAERINTYVYIAMGPPRDDDPQPIGTELQPDHFENHQVWDSLWLPEIQGYLARWGAFAHDTASPEELVAHIDQTLMWLARCWEIHGRIEFGPHVLNAMVDELIGWTAEEAADLVLGVESKSVEGDNALRALARVALETPAVRQAFLDLPPGEIFEALHSTEGTVGFRAELARYLGEFGLRSDNFHDIALPTWDQEPAPVLALLKLYVREPSYDAAAVQGAADEKRDAAQTRARAEIAERAPDRLEDFERELSFALRANVLNEDHNYWLDQLTMYWARQDMLAAGDRLVATNVIDERDDVFMLTLERVRSALGEPQDARADVASARAELEQWANVEAPILLGAPMPEEMKPILGAMFGQMESTSTATEVRGLGASAGVITGVARIIDNLDDADRLQEGDVLVATTTSPPWTPLFGIAGAVVTDAGGPMSHVGIVAREYGIPAVVGAVNATRLIRDGQRLRVDGSAGTVDLLEG